ncbi:SDR family oxidoreductase [Shigella flexneri]
MEKNGGGVVLTITSMAAENKNINMTSYASSKAEPVIWSENVALTWVKKYSGKWHCAGANINRCPEIRWSTRKLKKQKSTAHADRRLGQPQDIANAALFLCSPAASWVSGQILSRLRWWGTGAQLIH